MMDDDECPHGSDPGTCRPCNPAPRPAPVTVASGSFHAQYDGDCRPCGFPIHVGQQIVRLSDDSHVHLDCRP